MNVNDPYFNLIAFIHHQITNLFFSNNNYDFYLQIQIQLIYITKETVNSIIYVNDTAVNITTLWFKQYSLHKGFGKSLLLGGW
mgnify:CR=1 FL=1